MPMADDGWKIGIVDKLWERDNANLAKVHKTKDDKPIDYLPDVAKPEAPYFVWRGVRDYDGEISKLHLLNCDLCFGDFINEYSVGRGIAEGGQSELRKYLLSDNRLAEAMKNPDGSGLDALAMELKKKQLTRNISRSLVSKVAALAQPHVFIPYDSFARRGIAKVVKNNRDFFKAIPRKHGYKKYNETLEWYNERVFVVLQHTSEEVKREHKPLGKTSYKPRLETFHRRIVDMYLMAKGGRYDRKISPWEDHHIWPD